MEFTYFAGVGHTTFEEAGLFYYVCACEAQVDERFQGDGFTEGLTDESEGDLLLSTEVAH